MKKPIHIIILFVVIFASCSKTEPTTEAKIQPDESLHLTNDQLKTIGLEVGKIESRKVSNPIRVTGVLDVPPQNMVTIAAPMGGFVKNTELLQGMRVQKGQLVATLEHQDYIQLQQDYLDSKTQLEFLETEYKRQQELATENVNSAKVLQQTRTNYLSAKAKEEGLRARLKLMGLMPESIEREGMKSSIRLVAPIAGYVTEVNINQGQFVNSTDVMLKIVDTEHLHAEAQVFEKDVMQLRVGQNVKIRLANERDERLAKVYLIGKEISAERTVRVHCHLEKEDPSLIPGMYFNGVIETESEAVTALPENAVMSFEGVNYIFIQKSENTFDWIEVKTGISESGYTQVILPEDFAINTPVVIQGAYSLLSMLKNTEEE